MTILCFTDFPLESSLFEAFKLIKNADPDKYSYSECGIGFDAREKFSMSNGDWFSKNAIIFGVDNSSPTHVCNRKKDILILGISLTDGLDDTTITAKAYYFISFRNSKKKSLHYNKICRFLFVIEVKIYQFKAKYSKLKSLGKFQKTLATIKWKKPQKNRTIWIYV